MIENSASNDPRRPFKIGIIGQNSFVSFYVLDLVKWAKSEPNIELNYYIHQISSINKPKIKSKMVRFINFVKKNGLKRTVDHFLFLALRWCENLWLKKNEAFKNHLSTYSIFDLGLTEVEINPIVVTTGNIHRFNEKDITKIKALNLDLLLHCGPEILEGPIVEGAKFGLISFYHGDHFDYRGGPAGFWEVFNEEDSTGFVIKRPRQEFGEGEVYFKGHQKTKGYWLVNQVCLFTKANYYLKEFITKLSEQRTLPPILPHFPYSNGLYKKPNFLEIIRYLKKILVRKISTFFKSEPVWHVAFVHSDWCDAALHRGIELPRLPGKGLADPFVYSREGKDYCFAEEIDLATELGSIVVYELFSTYAVRLGTVCEEQFHLSFPYLFHYEDQVFMLVESHQNKDIRIYECLDFPLQWKLKHILMSNVSAADSLLINKENKWWLITNTDHWNDEDYCDEMSIFFADSPFSSEWTPHRLNPIYVDASLARNGGFFKSKNKLYRVSQTQGIDIYGKSVLINEITDLTEDSFNEVLIVEIFPRFKKNVLGTHHFHTNGSITVFDYYK
jgi:hypothetical protein